MHIYKSKNVGRNPRNSSNGWAGNNFCSKKFAGKSKNKYLCITKATV